MELLFLYLSQWATKWTLDEKSKVYLCKAQLVLDIIQSMGYLMTLKVLQQNSNGVDNELIKNLSENSAIYTTHIFLQNPLKCQPKTIYIIDLHNVHYRFHKRNSDQSLLMIPEKKSFFFSTMVFQTAMLVKGAPVSVLNLKLIETLSDCSAICPLSPQLA